MWILDTDHLSLLLRGHPQVVRQIGRCNPEDVVVTIVTVEEQLRGRLSIIQKASQPAQHERLATAYRALQQTLEDIENFRIVDFNEAALACYLDLLQQKIRIGTRDLRIAAIALSVHAILVTRNQKDFSKVPGLSIEDWTLLA